LANIGGVAEVIERAAGPQMKRDCKDIIRTKRKIQEGNNVTWRHSNRFIPLTTCRYQDVNDSILKNI
jgi:hypothetical protein